MIKDFKLTETYKHVQNTSADKPIALVFYTDTGVKVTPDNVDSIIETNYLRYKLKLDDAVKMAPALESLMSNLRDKITQEIYKFMDSNYLRVNTAFAIPAELDEIVKEIESQYDFAGWCMK